MAVMQRPSGMDELVVEANFPSTDPQTLFRYWTEPTLLTQWWPQTAETDPRVEGAYHLSWPQQDWHLRGRYTVFEPGNRLGFTWKWDHDPPQEPERGVAVVFESVVSGGTRLVLTHGPYRDTPEDQALRTEHHRAGWLHFLPRLQRVLQPDSG